MVKEELKFEEFFKIGLADDYILIRADFPMTEVSPSEFSNLLNTMFEKNDEVRRNGK